MPQPKQRNSVKLSIYISPELMEKLVEYQHTKRMKTLTEASIERIEKGFLNDLQSLTYQQLKCRSEIPAHYGKFVRCLEQKRIVTEEQCQACQLYQVVKIPLMTMEKYIETNKRLDQEQEQKANEVRKLDAHTKGALLRIIQHNEKTINAKDTELTTTRQLLHEKSEAYTRLEKDVGMLRDGIDLLLRETTEEKPQAIPQKIEPNPPILKRTTTIKEEFATPQQKLTQPTQQKTILPESIECPEIREIVNIEDTCKKLCQSRDTCKPYEEIIVQKAMPKQ